MTRGRPATLLELAISASAAVVPILVGVLLALTLPRAAADAPTAGSERHVSVRHVAALKTFEQAIVRRDRVGAPPPSADALLARLPQCRAEWGASSGVLTRMRAFVSPRVEAGELPAARLARELGELDRALARFSGAENRRVTTAVGLDGKRWLDAVESTLATPGASPDHPGRAFAVRCADIALAVRTLARGEARMLGTLAWRGTETERTLAHWRADQVVEISTRQIARANPWAGLPGCVYLRASDPSRRLFVGGMRGVDDSLCSRPDMVGDVLAQAAGVGGEPTAQLGPEDPRWQVPPSLATMLAPLDALRRPGGAAYRSYTRGAAKPNRVEVEGSAVDVGFSIDLTIDPAVQALAQRTAACYTGRDDVCRAFGIARRDDASRPLGGALLERAMVRMAAIAIIDVETGRIEALAGALSPCTREEHDGPGRSSSCDARLPYPIRYRPDALLNPAVFHDAMPASTIKPILATSFLADPVVGARWLAAERAEIARAPQAPPSAKSLRGELVRSDSARFLDRLFCADRDFATCARPWAAQAAAAAFGWNGGCAGASVDCGKREILFGAIGDARADGGTRAFALEVPYGRLLAEPSDATMALPIPPSTRGDARHREAPALRRRSRRPTTEPRRLGEVQWRRDGRRRRRRLGAGTRARERARRRRHDGDARGRRQWAGSRARAAPGRRGARCAYARRRRPARERHRPGPATSRVPAPRR